MTEETLHDFELRKRECEKRGLLAEGSHENLPIRYWARSATEGSHLRTRNSDGAWGPLQIMAPILSALGVVIFFSGLYIYWYRKNAVKSIRTKMPRGVRSGRLFGLFPNISYVREANRSNTWTIEPQNDIEGSTQGHYRLPSSPTMDDVRLPGPPQTKRPSSWIVRSFRKLADIVPVPWKKKPVTVQSVAPRRGFRIDEVDRRTSSAPSRPSLALTIDDEHEPGQQPWKYLPQPHPASHSSRSGTENLFPGNDPADQDDSDSAGTPEPEEEHTSLLSASSRMGGNHSVILISRNGENFTMESGDSQGSRNGPSVPHINTIPPSPIRAPPNSDNHQPSRPFLPPAPSYPAPQPSKQPRAAARTALAPLQETITPSPSIHPNASSLATRGLDNSDHLVNNPTLSPPLTNARQASDGGLRRTEHARRPSADNIVRSPPLHERTLDEKAMESSNLSLSADIDNLGRAIKSPSSSPHLPLPSHSQPQPSQSQSHPLHSHSRPQSPRRTPSPLPDHHRLLSADNNIVNHPYTLAGAQGSQTHLRSLSSDYVARPARTDPVMLFPGSVRAAGYPSLSPKPSTESLYSQGSFPRPPPGMHTRS